MIVFHSILREIKKLFGKRGEEEIQISRRKQKQRSGVGRAPQNRDTEIFLGSWLLPITGSGLDSGEGSFLSSLAADISWGTWDLRNPTGKWLPASCIWQEGPVSHLDHSNVLSGPLIWTPCELIILPISILIFNPAAPS